VRQLTESVDLTHSNQMPNAVQMARGTTLVMAWVVAGGLICAWGHTAILIAHEPVARSVAAPGTVFVSQAAVEMILDVVDKVSPAHIVR
jgi:hypothetical protein